MLMLEVKNFMLLLIVGSLAQACCWYCMTSLFISITYGERGDLLQVAVGDESAERPAAGYEHQKHSQSQYFVVSNSGPPALGPPALGNNEVLRLMSA